METFHRRCPEVPIAFVAVVTRLNIDAIDDLVAAGIGIGVSRFNLRQVAYQRDSPLADHDLMKTLVISVAEFLEMAERVTSKYANVAKFHIQSTPQLSELSARTRAESGLA